MVGEINNIWLRNKLGTGTSFHSYTVHCLCHLSTLFLEVNISNVLCLEEVVLVNVPRASVESAPGKIMK